MVFDTERPSLSAFLRPGCRKPEKENEAFFSFSRPEPKQAAPAGAPTEELEARTLGRWKGDSWRLPPHHYVDANMVKGSAVGRAAADAWVFLGPPELQAESVRGPAAAADRVLLARGRRGETAGQPGPAPYWGGEGP